MANGVRKPGRRPSYKVMIFMLETIELKTNRLKLRQWKESDLPHFAEITADPEVMKYFPNPLSRTESDELAHKIQSLISMQGWGLWAVEELKNNTFIGFVGLHKTLPELPFSPCIEIGWRLSKKYWGNGYATEAAKEVIKHAFSVLNLSAIYSFTPVNNTRSRALIGRLEMHNTHQNFEHPSISVGSPNKEHVLFKLTKEQWRQTAA